MHARNHPVHARNRPVRACNPTVTPTLALSCRARVWYNRAMNKWDDRYRSEPYDYTPNRRLAACLPGLAPAGRALDLACGGGRNTLLLAAHGWQVDAWDLSAGGLDLLTAEAARLGLIQRIEPRTLDLEAPGFTLPAAAWDLVVDTYFLHRPLLAQIPAAVRRGGWVFVSTYLDLGAGAGRSVRREFKLAPGELRSGFAGWSVLLDEEDPDAGLATFLAQRP